VRVTSAQIDLSAQHSLTEQHTRQEQLAIAVQANGTTRTKVLDIREQALASSTGFSHSPGLLEQEIARLDPELRTQLDQGEVDGEGLNATLLERADLAGLSVPSPELLRNTLNNTLSSFGLDLTGLGVMGSMPIDTAVDPADRLKMQLISAAVSAFSGREFNLLDPASLDLGAMSQPDAVSGPPGTQADSSGMTTPASGTTPHTSSQETESQSDSARATLVYSYLERHVERETTSFSAAGVVHTADGQQLDISVELTMGRQFISEEAGEVRVGAELQDPLVINFEGTAAELTERTFAFDLDNDGESDQIHFTGANSGFLALDANDNGQIDNGSELFGPATGNGFGELALYDEDGNDFIDEGDSVYESLRVWQKDTAGNDRLIALGEAGVGAIYLGSTTTPFQVKDDENELQGVVRSSGIYLKEEDGQPAGVGTVQQLDLVI
jgi:hypothetical protein